ncbi:hypothetical protein CMU85_10175 [Elizabethkingia anophelis]|nr:hypothetical protein [Elizabethkingia anophelis]
MPELNLLLLNILWQLVFTIIRGIKVFLAPTTIQFFQKKTAINGFYFGDVLSYSQGMNTPFLRLFYGV